MRYVVDGYNVTKRDPATSGLPLEAQREALVARLAVRGRDLLGPGEVTVVFDGAEGGGGEARRGSVTVRYARGESADDVVVRLATGPGVVVVTSDGGLARRVAGPGVRVVGAESCFEGRAARRTRGRYPAGTVGLPPGANEITRELKDLWLTDEE